MCLCGDVSQQITDCFVPGKDLWVHPVDVMLYIFYLFIYFFKSLCTKLAKAQNLSIPGVPPDYRGRPLRALVGRLVIWESLPCEKGSFVYLLSKGSCPLDNKYKDTH